MIEKRSALLAGLVGGRFDAIGRKNAEKGLTSEVPAASSDRPIFKNQSGDPHEVAEISRL